MTVILLAILAVLLVAIVLMFNRMIRLRNHTRSSWSDVDVALKRRAELVPNLVETVKGYATHEQQTIEQVTKARAESEAAHNVPAQGQAEGELSTALRRLMAVAENYPDLKASNNFLELQKQLATTEDRIAITRQVYNDTVQTYENAREQFPSSLVASLFAFKEVEFFRPDDSSDRDVVAVKTS